MSLKDRIKGRVEAFDRAARPWARRSRLNAFAYEFLLFGLKQAWACLFGGAMVGLLILTHFAWPAHAPLARYDFLVGAAAALQVALLATRLERWDEAFELVAARLADIRERHGNDAVAVYQGNPSVHNYGLMTHSNYFLGQLKTRAMDAGLRCCGNCYQRRPP